MASQNRKRRRKQQKGDLLSLWGGFFQKRSRANDITHGTLFNAEPDEDTPDKERNLRTMLRELWVNVSIWRLLAAIHFILFIVILLVLTIRMWQPQELQDIEGYGDKVESVKLAHIIKKGIERGDTIVITEAQINRYLRDTCRLQQDGFFSIFSQGHGVALRLHNGYAEVVIDRIIGAGTHQTTSVFVTIRQELKDGKPTLRAELHGGDPIFGSIPRGGTIGRIPIPQRHIIILQPALESLRDTYPDIRDAILNNGYCPEFEDGRIILRPFTSN